MGIRYLHAFIESLQLARQVNLSQLAQQQQQRQRQDQPLKILVDGNGLLFHLLERAVGAYGDFTRALDMVMEEYLCVEEFVEEFVGMFQAWKIELQGI